MTPARYKELREQVGTQAEVAEILELSRYTITRRETGAMAVTPEAALAMERLVEVRGKPERKSG